MKSSPNRLVHDIAKGFKSQDVTFIMSFWFYSLLSLLDELNKRFDNFLNIIFNGNLGNILFFAKELEFLSSLFIILLKSSYNNRKL